MKILYLLRHAKASWDENVDDHGRKLKKRGKNDAVLVAEEVVKKLSPPEKIISSDAERARATAEVFKSMWEIKDADFIMEPRLYDFQGGEVLKFLKEVDDHVHSLMLVGHNYAFTAIANRLGNERIDEIPTCGFVMLRFDVDSWNDVSRGETVLKVFPRHLKI
ncbi:MAG TPA: histidine phosphatase family protein [Flavobacteriaceae bacterium]|nr:histidine phosphatase family protein [Flavobacteriaceae bacterium]